MFHVNLNGDEFRILCGGFPFQGILLKTGGFLWEHVELSKIENLQPYRPPSWKMGDPLLDVSGFSYHG